MYLTGGATAALEGWRATTGDVDVPFEPDSDAALRRIAELKEELQLKGPDGGRALLSLFDEIEPELFRFPAVDPVFLRAAVESLG